MNRLSFDARKAADHFLAGIFDSGNANAVCASRFAFGCRGLPCCGTFGGRFLSVTFVEAIHAPCRVHKLLFSCEERVAGRADFYVQIAFLSRASLKRLAAGAGDRYFIVFGVNSSFHYLFSRSTP